MRDGKIYILDLAAKLDETATYLCSESWKTRNGDFIEFPAPFGRDLTPEVRKKFKNLYYLVVAYFISFKVQQL